MSQHRTPWFVSSFGPRYQEIYRQRTLAQARDEAAFARERLALGRGDRVLDLCCGAGRHIDPLREEGVEMVGVDLSAPLLAAARARLGDRAWLARGDMRAVPLCGARFSAVLSFFTSFGYFFDESENRQVLTEIARLLRPGGRFLLDLMDRQSVIDGLVATSDRVVDDKRIHERRSISDDGARVEKVTTVLPLAAESTQAAAPAVADGTSERYHESVRLYEQSEVAQALEAVGLTIDSTWGDFAGTPYQRAATPRMILVGHRGEERA